MREDIVPIKQEQNAIKKKKKKKRTTKAKKALRSENLESEIKVAEM